MTAKEQAGLRHLKRCLWAQVLNPDMSASHRKKDLSRF